MDGSGVVEYAGGGPCIEAGRLGNRLSSRREDIGDEGVYEAREGNELLGEWADA